MRWMRHVKGSGEDVHIASSKKDAPLWGGIREILWLSRLCKAERDKELGWLSPDLDSLDEEILSKSETAKLQAKTPSWDILPSCSTRLAPRKLD